MKIKLYLFNIYYVDLDYFNSYLKQLVENKTVDGETTDENVYHDNEENSNVDQLLEDTKSITEHEFMEQEVAEQDHAEEEVYVEVPETLTQEAIQNLDDEGFINFVMQC